MRIVIMGSGGVGAYVGARLQAAGEDVAFIARSKVAGRAQQLAETSRFVRDSGQWFYVDGDLQP